MYKLKLNIQLFAATATITNARQGSYSIENNNEVQRITFTVKRTSGTTYWQDNKTLTFTLKYYNNDGTQTTLTQTKQFNFPSGSVGATKSTYVDFTVPHKTDGTQRITFEASITTGTSAGTLHPTGEATLETIPRASTITVNDANIGSGTTITINRASENFTTTLRYKAFDENVWSDPIVTNWREGSYGWTVPTSFYSKIPNAKTMICYFKAETYSGSTFIGEKTTQATFTATGNPVINSCSLVSTDSTTTNLVGSSRMIRYISTVQATVSASPAHNDGSSISSIIVNGVTASNGVATFPNATTYSYNVVVTDSRGYTATGTYTITWTNYIPLTINATIKRHTPVDGIINISLNGNYFNSSFRKSDDTYIANTLTVEYRYKVSGSSSWEQNWTSSGVTITKSGNTYTATKNLSGMTYTNSYQFEVRAIDRVDTKAITGITVTKGQPIFNWRDGYFNVNGDYYKNGSPLSNSFLSTSGGTISGNLNVTGNLQKSGSNVALASAIPTNTNQLTNGAGFITLSDIPISYARIKVNTNYNASTSESWVQTNVSFSDATYESSNASYFTQKTNGIQCNFNGTVLVTKLLSTHSDNEMDIVENDSNTIAATNTKGGNTTVTYVQTVTSGQLINLKFNAKDTSFRIHATTQITVLRLK